MSAFTSHLKNLLKKTGDAIEKPHLKQRIIFIIVFTLIIIAFAVLFMPKTAFSYYNPPQGSKDSGEIIAGDGVYQPFITGDIAPKSLLIDFNTYDRDNYVVYTIELLDKDKKPLADTNGNVYPSVSFNATLIQKDEPYGIPLYNYELSPGTEYNLHIYSDEAEPGNAIGVYISQNIFGAGEMLIGNKPSSDVLDMQIGYSRWSNNILIIAVLLCVAVGVSALFWSPENMARNTLITVLILGVFFALITPMMDSPDEPFHAGTAFALAEGEFLKTVEEQVTYTRGFKLISDNYIQTAFSERSIDPYQIPNLVNNEFKDLPVPAETITTNWGSGKYFLGYLPQTIGLWLGRLFNMNLAAYFYTGRIFNIIIYALLAFLAVKTAPKFKLYLSLIALLPMSLFIAGTYNPDGLTYGLALLVGAKFTDMFFDKDKLISVKDILIMALLTALLCMNKYTLGLLALLTFFIPAKRFRWRELKWIGAVFILVISFFAAYGVMQWENYAANGTSSLTGGFINERGANASMQLNWLISNPGTAATIFANGIMNGIGQEMLNLFALGGTREYALFDIISIAYFAFLAVVAFAYTRFQTDGAIQITVPVRTRILLFGVIIITIFLTYLALYLTWTPLYLNTIEGVQSRYFVGLFPIIPFLGQNIWPQVTEDALIRSRYNCLFIAVLVASLTLMTSAVKYY